MACFKYWCALGAGTFSLLYIVRESLQVDGFILRELEYIGDRGAGVSIIFKIRVFYKA